MTQVAHTDCRDTAIASPRTMDDIKDLLFVQFPVLADAPESVPRMRELILQLAVRGKLAPQDPDDEPASELLKAIAAEKIRLVANGKIKKQKLFPPIAQGDIPYDLPEGWACERLGNVSTKTGSGSTPRGGRKVYTQQGVMFLRSQNVWNHGLELRDVARITSEIHQHMAGTQVQPQDLLLNITGASIGRCTVVPDSFPQANVSQHVCIIRLVAPETKDFMHTLLISPDFQRLIMNVQVGMSREGLSKKRLDMFPLPIPPLHEQRRIVAKVDQLMALCDELQARQEERNQGRVRLNKAALHSLTEAQEPEAVATHWNRIHSQFDLMYDTPETVPDLRQAILQLAVRGKLATQDHSDEPATELVKKIAVEKARLIAEGRMKKQKLLPPIDQGEVPYNLPRGWVWARLGDVLTFGPKNGWSPKPVPSPTSLRSITLSATTSGRFDASHFKYLDDNVDLDDNLWLSQGDILIQRSNTEKYVGIVAVYDGPDHEFIYPDLMMKFRVSEVLSTRFCHLTLNSPGSRWYFRDRATGTSNTMKKINQGTVNCALIGLPPLAEQKRIVTKTDQLMVLCDDLESKLGTAQVVQSSLLDAVVGQVVNGRQKGV